ncbi:MAG: PAS-domain containing protein [Xanthomonadales bacterium]|nr:PAS-domain containing protein [Xanthomonadales bacterium]
MALAHRLGSERALQRENEQVQRQLQLHAQALRQRIDRYRTLPQVLALDPELRQALLEPLTEAIRERLNRRLEDANNVTRSSTLTLINAQGIALAASNWRLPTSNVGEDYSFRPYVQQALRSGQGQFYGIGLTTGAPGYFLSQAIVDAQDRAIGLVVIKIELDALEREWLQPADVVLLSDSHGVIFLASQPAWRYRTLAPLSAADQRELARTQQYARQTLRPIESDAAALAPNDGGQLSLIDPALPAPVLWRSLALPGEGWQLHLLHDASAIAAAGRSAALAAGGGGLALSFLLLFVLQRRRTASLRQRSRAELEAVLQQHAHELRTAQDGIVEAARQADAGLSRSLEHLPQGVVIIDAELNLVAWNSRYAELFRFPPELLRVGTPIRELFRFNANRGLLGPGPIELAIERRMNHLRSGKPHLRESEKDDGTVLEIRGNPLPDGGFVTSYADITSYKNAARELRSLADALEHRIAERTRDLAAAKQEAEVANRHKSRFVASAVHDLLQPLNAARMFLSALRSRLQSAESRRMAEHVDQALAAQDAILNSLLDISRLESGTLAVQPCDVAVGPLLQALAREFGIVAQARGLQLRHVPCSATVRTDADLLRRILLNLLANAVRYTPSGRILLGCRRTVDGVRVEVHDQGPGIPDSLQREIFEEFRRLDNAGAASGSDPGGGARGAGLGLAIVERIGRLLDHRIGLRSRLGHGSIFSVELPWGDPARAVDPVATSDPEHDQDSTLRGVRVVCIDDDPQVCAGTRTLLQRWDCEVLHAGGPEQALALAGPDTAPDVLLLDVHLGHIEGPDLVVPLCQRWQAEPAIVLVTAERDPALQALARSRGWGYLSKPVRPPALRSLISQLLLRRVA